MQNELDPMIEKYRHELMEYSRCNPKFSEAEKSQPAEKQDTRIRPNGNLYRTDFDTQPCADGQPQEPPHPRAAGETAPDNAAENAVSVDSIGKPPYNNGAVVEYRDKETFLNSNTHSGFLRVQVSAADQAFPIQNADIVVSKHFEDSDAVFFEEHTDSSGIVDRITLPAPDRKLSASPTLLQPYSTYDISVTHPGYIALYLKNCAIFDGIETIQQVVLIPSVPGVHLPAQVENEEGES